MPRSLLALVVVGAVLAAAPAALAAPATYRSVPLDVTFEFEYTTTWNQPKHWSLRDCGKTVWSEGKGSESLKLRSRQPKRLLFKTVGAFSAVEVPLVDGRLPRHSTPLAGPHARQHQSRIWHEMGPCTGPPRDDTFKGDCGTRLPSFVVLFQWNGVELTPQMGGDHDVPQRDRDQQDFQNCPVLYPEDGPGEAWNLRSRKLPLSKVWGQRSFTVGDTQSWKEESVPEARPFSTSSTLTWKATFKRAGRVETSPTPAAAPTPPKKKRGKKGRRG